MTRLARILFLLVLAGPLAAQTKVPYSSLGASNATLRFFPSQSGFPVAAERVYPATFDSATTKYLNVEISINYPKVTAPVSFDLACRYNGPQGELEGTPTFTGNILAGWTGSTHAGGWGSKEGAHFPVGAYQVSCRDGAAVVAAGRFVVTRDRFDVPAVRGMVNQIRMYEAGTDFVPLDQRRYGPDFDGRKTRYIKTELELVFPETREKVSYSFECTYQYPNGQSYTIPFDVFAEAGWTQAFHSAGRGSDTPGSWDKGTYNVTCRNQGSIVAQRSFTVY